jgi:hypothetical protein
MHIELTQEQFELIVQAWYREYRENHWVFSALNDRFLTEEVGPLGLSPATQRAAEHAVYTLQEE